MKNTLKLAFTGACCLVLTFPVLAQKSKLTSTWNYMRNNELDKAKASIDEAATNPETINNPKTWYYRGNVYRSIQSSKQYQGLSADPLGEALASYKKAAELDKKNEFPEAKDSLLSLAQTMFNQGVKSLNSKEWGTSISAFNNYLSAYNAMGAEKQQIMNNMLKQIKIGNDDVHLYMANAAEQLGDHSKAHEVYQQMLDANTQNPDVYRSQAKLYLLDKDTAKALTTLEKGIQNLPADKKKDVLIDELNIYITQGKKKEALSVGQKALEVNKNNPDIYIALGSIYDQLSMPADAEKMYNQALALDTTNFRSYYSLGISLFNQGADRYNMSINEKDMKKSTALENQAKDLWKKSIPYLEKAGRLKTDDKLALKDVYRTLKEMYAKLGDFNKSNEYKEKMNKL